jgi:hypothetical protein
VEALKIDAEPVKKLITPTMTTFELDSDERLFCSEPAIYKKKPCNVLVTSQRIILEDSGQAARLIPFSSIEKFKRSKAETEATDANSSGKLRVICHNGDAM